MLNATRAGLRPALKANSAGKLDISMVANRNSRASWIGRRSAQQEGDTPYELVAVCMWSVLGVALVALVLWLALGGTI
jgi:hypothetical protein